jgi:hypothetical protein
MTIPKGQALIAFLLSAVLILGGAQLALPPSIQLAQAQTSQCVVVDKAEPAQLGITVSYIPNPGAFPTENAVEIQRRVNAGAWTNMPNLPANTRSFVDSSVTQGNVENKYEYRVRVVNDDGQSGWSEIGCKTIKRQLRPPPTPTLVVS